MKIRYQVRVSSRYILSPLPPQVDREALQVILDAFSWNALPLSSKGRDAWIVGADPPPPAETLMVAGSLVLIVQQRHADSRKANESLVVAAPEAVKKFLDSALPPPQQVQPILPRQDVQLDDLRDEVEKKFKAMHDYFNSTVVSLKDQLSSTAAQSSDAAAAIRAEVADIIDRFRTANSDRWRSKSKRSPMPSVQRLTCRLCFRRLWPGRVLSLGSLWPNVLRTQARYMAMIASHRRRAERCP